MDHNPYIRLVHAHSESIRRNNNFQVAFNKRLLNILFYTSIKTSMEMRAGPPHILEET